MIVTTSRATFPMNDVCKLPQVLASDIVLQLLNYIQSVLHQALPMEKMRSRIFLDEMEEVIRVAESGTLR